jgi:hypothetical protein
LRGNSELIGNSVDKTIEVTVCRFLLDAAEFLRALLIRSRSHPTALPQPRQKKRESIYLHKPECLGRIFGLRDI